MPGLLSSAPELGFEVNFLSPYVELSELSRRPGVSNEFLNSHKIYFTKRSPDTLEFFRKRLRKKVNFDSNSGLTEKILGDQSNKRLLNRLRSYSLIFLRKLWDSLVSFPDEFKSWIQGALTYDLDFSSYDILISSSPYFSSHTIAHHLSKRYNLFWAADYRDTWSTNPHYNLFQFRKRIDSYYERKIMRRADFIFTASSDYQRSLQNLFSKEVSLFTNGFFPLIESSSEIDESKSKKFTIAHTGAIYPETQNPELLFQALEILFQRKPQLSEEIELIFAGQKYDFITKLVDVYRLSSNVKQVGRLSWLKSRTLQEQSDLLVFFATDKTQGSSLKFFEYLSTKKPILIPGITEKSETAYHLKRCSAGFFSSSVTEIVDILEKLIVDWKKGTSSVTPNNTVIEEYNYFSISKIFLKRLKIASHQRNK